MDGKDVCLWEGLGKENGLVTNFVKQSLSAIIRYALLVKNQH